MTNRQRNKFVMRYATQFGGFILAISAMGGSLEGYTSFQNQVKGTAVPSRWAGATVTWQLNPARGPNVDSTSGHDPIPAAAAITKAFQTWQQAALNGVAATQLSVTRGPDTAVTDSDMNDCTNVISFAPSDAVSFPTGTVAITTVSTAYGPVPSAYACRSRTGTRVYQTTLPSQIVDADIMFNPHEQFSTSTPALPGHFDLQSIATHEVGHLLGLDHDGIAHMMMYPFGDTGTSQQRELGTDDVLGIAFLYPAPGFLARTGTVSGRVTSAGSAVFASHVVLVDKTTGVAVMDGLSAPDGSYRLVGVPPGRYKVLALPLAGPYSLQDFGGWACGFAQNAAPCCDPNADTQCHGKVPPVLTSYNATFY
jgi:hypothetical protein